MAVLHEIARYVALSLDAVAVLMVVIGALEAVFGTSIRRSRRPGTISGVWPQWLPFAHSSPISLIAT